MKLSVICQMISNDQKFRKFRNFNLFLTFGTKERVNNEKYHKLKGREKERERKKGTNRGQRSGEMKYKLMILGRTCPVPR